RKAARCGMTSQNFVTDCFYNLTTDERIDLFKRRQGLRLDHVFRTYYGWMPFPFAILGIALTTCFIVTVYDAIRRKRVSRKCYILLLNRAIGDFLSCAMVIVSCLYVFNAKEVNRDVLSILEIFFVGSFWSGTVSYVSLSALKLFAVARPFDYRKCVTMKRCIHLIVISWVIFAGIILYSLTLSAFVKVPYLNELTHCKAETCLRFMYRSRNFITTTLYFCTLIIFGITVVLIKRAQRFVDSFKKGRSVSTDTVRKTSRFPLWKLSLNVLTFAGLNLFYVVWCVGLLINQNQCFFMRNYTELMRVLAFVRLTLLIRICVDPILSFVTDFQVRRGFLNLIGVQRKITFSSSRGIFVRTNTSNDHMDNSSEGPSNGSQHSSRNNVREIRRVDNRPTSQKKLCPPSDNHETEMEDPVGPNEPIPTVSAQVITEAKPEEIEPHSIIVGKSTVRRKD
ncbi:hypothetical protein PMAYCL1PPCAC_26954, partial [Pristionchus mayeri]